MSRERPYEDMRTPWESRRHGHHATTIAHAVNARHGEWPTTRHVGFLSCFLGLETSRQGVQFFVTAEKRACFAGLLCAMQRALGRLACTPRGSRHNTAHTELREPISTARVRLQVAPLAVGCYKCFDSWSKVPTPMLRKPRRRHMGTWESRRRNAHNPLPSPTSGGG
jgi:hypothetical protein